MNTTLIAMGIASLVVLGLVVNLGVLSLLTGAFHFLFGKPKLEILKTTKGENGFAFGFKWNNAREPAKFDTVKLRLFNPFGSPSQVEVSSEFKAQDSDFGMDLDLGIAFGSIINAQGLDNSTIQVEMIASKSGVTHHFQMKTRKFLENYRGSDVTAEQYMDKHGEKKGKVFYHQTSRSFIADPLPEGEYKILKISSNPAFAGAFAGAAAADATPAENFAVAKVWIEDGCIVCNACEGIYPEVFEVTDTNCVIRPDAPLNDGLKILEAAEACPVEIIKFDKAN